MDAITVHIEDETGTICRTSILLSSYAVNVTISWLMSSLGGWIYANMPDNEFYSI